MSKELKTLEEIGKIIEKHKLECFTALCKRPIKAIDIGSYNHENGSAVKGFAEKQWIYFECPYCDYQLSLKNCLNLIKEKEGKLEEAKKPVKHVWSIISEIKGVSHYRCMRCSLGSIGNPYTDTKLDFTTECIPKGVV